MTELLTSATAFAPATVANVAVGFDLMGFAISGFGDTVTVRHIDEPTVKIDEITGVVPDLPLEAEKNTAGVVLLRLLDKGVKSGGFALKIQKGIPLGSGMGGSAASAAGALVAANKLLKNPLPLEELYLLSLFGETLAGGAPHGDNVGPCLTGGLLLARSVSYPVDLVHLPIPSEIRAVVVHPHICISTKEARAILRSDVPLKSFIEQSGNLAGFISACYTNDYKMIGRCLRDVVIEPQRAALIPGFADARKNAFDSGALGFSISGSGPAVFALCRGDEAATKVRKGIVEAFLRHSLPCDEWSGSISELGAYIVSFS
ncbi:MAG: homoserine kinase [Candidatus Riflebacteria bacterium]|nr:homoserine kinase [Candidatus Riflebacteria bacterium]